MLKISEGADPNYLATVVKIPKIMPHGGADKLELVEVFGNTIVIGKGSYIEGEVVVYFPTESVLSGRFLSYYNLYDNPLLNRDGTTKSYFSKSGRVKAVKLRGVPSQGVLFKVSELAKYYGIDENEFRLDSIFDTVGDDVLVTKYIKGERVAGEANVKKSRVPKWIEKTIGVFPRPIRKNAYGFVNAWYNRDIEGIKSKIVDGHWHFHYKTQNLGQNVWLIKPEDEVTITSKVHGTSAIYGMVLCNKTFNPLRSLWNKIGGNIKSTEYKFIYSSRSLLKNRKDGTYAEDVWGNHAKVLDKEITYQNSQGLIFFGEIVGWASSGKMIQKNYDYGVEKGKSEFWVYRATYTSENGTIRELGWNELELVCRNRNLKMVPLYYKGLAKDVFDGIPVNEEWPQSFLHALKAKYLDKKCEFCTTGAINEGIVLRNESSEKKPALKFKSPLFVVKETKARDNNEENLDEDS